MILLSFALLVIGFVILVYGADLLVDSASTLAHKLNVSDLVIGLTIVAFGTSAPELAVNIFAAIDKNTDLILGNILGSNILNIAVILGITSIIYPLSVKKNTTWVEIPSTFLASIVLFIMANDIMIDLAERSELGRSDGMILLLFFILFMGYNIFLAMTGRNPGDEIDVKNYSTQASVFYILIGLVMLTAGGHLIVDSAISIAETLGISQRIIALTIVSFGTSLPELATSVAAARKKNVDMAIGNIVGSNLFNSFLVLGISSVIFPVNINMFNNIDIYMNIFISFMLFVFIFNGRDRKLVRWEGILLIVFYLVYASTFFFWK